MTIINLIAVFLVYFMTQHTAKAQVMFPGACPDKQVVTDFQLDRYVGKWYEIKKYFALFDDGKCVTATYTYKGNGVIDIRNEQQDALGSKSVINGGAKLTGPPNEGKLIVWFSSMPINMTGPYWVLAVDYDDYALVWTCMDRGLMHAEMSWVLTRERHPSQNVIDTANTAIEKNKIDQSHYIETDQSNCNKKKN